MRVGTKSILFGAHAFWLHPWFVAAAWWRLYGFPWDPRLWAAFFVHDLGYWGKPNMDGDEGETHPIWGAFIMHWWFDPRPGTPYKEGVDPWKWHDLTLYHSRFYAKRYGERFSRLCVADKLALCLTPWWLYRPMTRCTGEIHEYLLRARSDPKYRSMALETGSGAKAWYRDMQDYLRKWVEEHRDGREDTWTPAG